MTKSLKSSLKHEYCISKGVMIALLSVCYSAQADEITEFPVQFEHQDWQLVCDNTRTCRAVGYTDTQREPPYSLVALMLERPAGADSQVSGYVAIQANDFKSSNASDIQMSVNGQVLGGLLSSDDVSEYRLSDAQVSAVLATLPSHSDIRFNDDKQTYYLSDAGSTAVLLKMDEVQGRANTPTAIVQKGHQSLSRILPLVAMPVRLQRATIDTSATEANFETHTRYLAKVIDELAYSTVRNQIDESQDIFCPALEKDDDAQKFYADSHWQFYSLDDSHLLAEHVCWRGAYNVGLGYWLWNVNHPTDITLITDSGSGYDDGEIVLEQKGRGMGDCWSFAEWVWTGDNFDQTREGTTGQCRGFAGGAFVLPTFVSEVR